MLKEHREEFIGRYTAAAYLNEASYERACNELILPSGFRAEVESNEASYERACNELAGEGGDILEVLNSFIPLKVIVERGAEKRRERGSFSRMCVMDFQGLDKVSEKA